MGRIIAIDYGSKRCGIAVTDPLKMIANPLTTVHSKDILNFITDYISKESVECIVIGEPKRMDNSASDVEKLIAPFIKQLQKKIPKNIKVERMDERFTSKMASRAILEGGAKKKDRQNKELVDTVSATLILQSFLEANG